MTPSTDYRLIPLTQGQFSKVSSEDFDWISQWKWCAHWRASTSSFIACRNVVSIDGKRRVDGKWKHLGYRKSAEAAYLELYLPAAKELHGEYAAI